MARASRRPMAAGSAASLAAVRAGALVRPLVRPLVGAFVGALAFATIAPAHAEEIGSVNTHFRVTGSDRVVIEAYDDPEVDGITCYVSRARTGGIKGSLGMAEDPAEASIACRQVGKIAFKGPLRQQDNVFSERMSILFKTLHVVRVVDRKRNTLVYLTYSDRIVSGSPKNSVTAVPVEAGTPIPLR
ncbi:CreA family protein [Cupriavidus cauae]|uniref:CreA family protein n=1 Tax=Cupriavidus cauae TaxID=2608999 RepID=UPI001CC1DACE|nr:CreA family protein [Cupriavidus cauae]